MEAKNVLYAAVGAPVVVVRKVGDRVADWREQLSKENVGYSRNVGKLIDEWATEGKKVVERIGNGTVVEEISSKVDLDQAKEQVGKLRDQLEDMLETWRTSFRPEKTETVPAQKQPAHPQATKSETAKPAAKTSTTKKQAAKAAEAKKAAPKTAAANEPSKETESAIRP